MIKLRAHHLLCMLTYVGEGYNDEFVANYDQVIARIQRGEPILIVAGPDDVCAPLLCEESPHCLRCSVGIRDMKAARLASEILSQPIYPGAQLELDKTSLDALRQAYSNGHFKNACEGCEWVELCMNVADGGYRDVRLRI